MKNKHFIEVSNICPTTTLSQLFASIDEIWLSGTVGFYFYKRK